MTTQKKKRGKGSETTLLVLVVDRSGSMESIRQDMEGGIAALLTEQATEDGICLVTLAQFDNEYELLADAVPVSELLPYRLVPRGSTALLDAMGRTISTVRAEVDDADARGPTTPHRLRRHHRRVGERIPRVESLTSDGLRQGPRGRGLEFHVLGRQSGRHSGGWTRWRGWRLLVDVRFP